MLKRTTLSGTMLPYGFFVCLILLPAGLWAQCGFLNKQENGNTYSPRTTNQTVGIGNAAFLRFDIKNGDNTSYAFDLCGIGYDAQLTGYNGGTAVFYNDDNSAGAGACTNCTVGNCTPGTAPALTWTSTFTGTLNVQANRYNCLDWGSGIGSATLNYRCNAPNTPAIGTAGNGTWNIYCYDAGDAGGGSGAWSSNYSGYYTDNTLGFNTATRWANTPYEANATGGQAYRGCYILPDNHSWRAIRTNIPCGAYQLQVNHDDIGQILINGVSVYNNAVCCASTNAGTFVISPSDVIEYRVSEGGGGSGGQIAFNSAASTLNAGTITYGGSTAACGSYDPPAFGSSAAASGGTSAAITGISGQGVGTSTYQWQVNGGDIGGATGLTYDAPNITVAGTYVYRRRVTDECGVVAYTNTFTVTITAVPTAASNTTSTAAICETSTKALVGAPAGGAWTVQSGGGTIGGTTYTPANVTVATAVTVRYTIAAVGACPATTADVTFTVDADPGTASNTTSTAAICETSTKTLVGTPAGGTWTVQSGGGTIGGTTYTPANVTSATSVTIRYTIGASGSCPGSTSDVTFTVDASPGTASNTTSNAAICETSTKALIGTPAGGTWTVQSGGGTIGGTTYTPANVTSATSVTVRYTIGASGTCAGSTSDVTFTVDADPGTASNITSNAPICETSTKALVGTPAGGTWTVQSGGGTIGGTTYTPANVTSATSVTIRYTIGASGSCPGSTSDVTFTVDASPGTASNTTSNAPICETSTKALVGTPAGGTWTVQSGGGTIGGTTYTPANVTSATSVTVRYSLPASGTCAGSTSDVTFTVDADPGTASNTTSNAPICETSTKALVGTPAGGTWTVQSGGGTIGGTTYTPANVTSATSVTIRYSIAGSGSCPGSTSDVTFTVDADPGTASNTTSNAPICETSNKALTGTPAGGTWTVQSGGGTIGGTTYTPANVTSATSVTVRYSLPASGTCPGSTSDVTFTVDADPGTASNTTSAAAICETSTKTLVGTPAGGTWTVQSGGGTIGGTTYTPANVTSATSVTIRYSIAGSGTCAGSTSDVTFTVDADPGTASNTTSSAAICETSNKALTGTPAGGTWTVQSGGGTIGGTTYTPANVTSATSVTIRYSVAASGSCSGSTSDVTFTVDADPGTASNTTSSAAICETSNKALTATPAGGTWTVQSGGGSIGGTTYTPANVTSATSVTIRYSVAASGNCPGSTSDVTFTVDADPGTASNTTSNADICETATKALVGAPAGGSWTVQSGGGAIAGTTYTPANVTSATSVTIRYAIAGSGTCAGSTSDVTFTVNPIPAAFSPTVVTTTPLCFGGNAKIDFSGESGVSYQLRDVTTNVNSPGNGPGTVELHTNNLTANISTYNVLATAGVGSCTLNVSVPAITVSATPTALANNNDARTCYINGNNAYVEFFSANGSIIAINPGTQNLGDVTVTEFVGAPLGIQACFTSPTAEPQFNTATLGRHWTISSTVAPSSNLNVRLYFANADVAALAAASIANVNTLDNVSTSADMELSKYSGANENSNFADNCGNGTVTLHPQVGSGAMSAGNIGYNVSSAGYTVHTVSSFSELWLSGTGNVSPLPIELTSFEATCADGSVLLMWETASEINNEKFLVERSPNLQVWEEVSVLSGAGNSNQPLHYQITDERPLQGLSYYRLTQRDYDGKSETFAPISITCYSDGKGNSMMVYPNPATHVFNVSVTATETSSGKLELLDANGKTLVSQGVNLVQGSNTFSVSAETLNPGTYVIYLRTQNLDLKPVKVLVIK